MFINLLEIIYPIGAFYISNNNTSPAELIGGEWEQIVGAALRGDNEIGYTGQDTHTITVNEMPNHKHQASNRYFSYTAGGDLNAPTYGTAQKITNAGDTAYTGGAIYVACPTFLQLLHLVQDFLILSFASVKGVIINGLY